ncbi:MAG: DNA repair protein RadC [Burkholderiaceae bacterium]|nr:DNA repair protein RadC [Burkholderiaceae bacterium]
MTRDPTRNLAQAPNSTVRKSAPNTSTDSDSNDSARPPGCAPRPAGAHAARAPVSAWPPGERPRERLLSKGAEALTDAELLAVVLRTGLPGTPVLELARHLLVRFGGLAGLTGQPVAIACREPGLGPARWAGLQAAIALARRTLHEDLVRGDMLADPARVRDFLRLWLRDRRYEVFAALFVDAQHRLLAAEELFRGTLTQTAVYPREVVRRAIELNAAAVVFAHNHPSGATEPSPADRALTRALVDALRPLDIGVLDHFIVAGNHCLSFAERGLL